MGKYDKYSLEELEQLQEMWEVREESEQEPDFRQEWVEEGIEIYEALLRKKVSNEQKFIYARILASLYLEFGRSEKMIQLNLEKAFKSLQRGACYLPEKGDTFYHLAFLAEKMTAGKEKWESAAFYAKEALDRGIDEEKQIKIWCLIGKSYLELGLREDAAKCFSYSKNLDSDDDFYRFRAKYSKNDKEKSAFFRLEQDGIRINRRAERETWIEKSKRGECYVLEIHRRGAALHGNGESVVLNMREAELLRLLFEWDEGLTKFDILQNAISSMDKSEKSIKTDISRIRSRIKKELGIDGGLLIQLIGDRPNQKYIWNPKIEKYLIE
jgi:tetratricopeptide (TPR) repeat protein